MEKINIFTDNIYLDNVKKVNKVVDLASQQQKEIFDKPWYTKHFAQGGTHVADVFDTILDQMHFDIAASTIQRKSEMPLRAMEGINTLNQNLFTYAHGFRLEKDEIVKLSTLFLIARGRGDKNEIERIKGEIYKRLFSVKAKAVNGVRSRLDIIIMEGLSNGGVFTFTTQNDPGSPCVGTTIDFGMPSENKWTVGSGREWTMANKANMDVLADLDDIKKGAGLVKPAIALIDRETMDAVVASDKLKGYINSTLYPNMPLSDEMVNNFLRGRGLPVFEVVERETLIQKGDMLVPYTPWKKGQVVLIPQETIGTIETRLSDAELGVKDPGVELSYYGRIELHEYKMGEAQGTDYTEITKAVLTAAPAISSIKNIHVLDTTK